MMNEHSLRITRKEFMDVMVRNFKTVYEDRPEMIEKATKVWENATLDEIKASVRSWGWENAIVTE